VVIILVLFFASAGFTADDPKESELLFMARKAYEDGFYEVSLGMLERFQKTYPGSDKYTQAALLSGQCYFYQGRYLEALNIFESLANNPAAVNLKDALYFWTAEVHFKGNNFDKAAQLYQKLIDNFSQSSFVPAAYYSLGWSLAQLGKFDQAAKVFENLIAKFPREPQSKDAVFKLIECLYNLKKYSELEARIKPAFKLYSNDSARLPYLYFYLAESQYYLDNFEEAAKNYFKSAQISREPQIQALAKLGLGWAYLKLLKYKEAEDVIMEIKSTSLDKKSLDILILGQAVLMSQTNRLFEAKKLYEQLINENSDPLISLQADLGKADALYNLAEYPQAISLYKEVLEKTQRQEFKDSLPQELIDKLRYNLGLAYIRQGQVNQGLDVFNAIVGNDNNQAMKIDLLFQIAQAYEDQDELLKAEEAYAMLLRLYPDSPFIDYAQYQQALVQVKRKELAIAFANFRSLPKKYPQSKLLPDAAYALGTAYFTQGDYAQASEAFARFKDEFKDNALGPQALYMLGTSYISLGKFNDALGVFKGLAKLDPLDIELKQKVEYEIADCYYKLGQENEALNRFKFLRTKYPNSQLSPDILWWLGQYYYRNKNVNLARRYFDALTKDFPQNQLAAQAYYALGLTFGDENNFEQAADNFKTAIKLGDADIKTQSQAALADTYSRLGNTEEALVQYNRIIKDASGSSQEFFSRMAQVYYKMGNYPEAKKYYLKSLETATPAEAAGLRFSLAEVLEANAETDEALKQYLMAADLSMQSPEMFTRSLLRAAKLNEDKENFKDSLQIYRRIIEKTPQAPEAAFAQERVDWIRANTKAGK
jgi:TolA-binding protein